MPALLADQRILLTHADRFMGPTLTQVLSAHGAQVVANTDALIDAHEAEQAVAAAGAIDTLIIHLAVPAPQSAADAIDDIEWRDAFAAMVDPMPRLVRAALPHMKAQGHGKILVMGSAAALRGQKRCGTYSAARGAQLAYAQAIGLELAPLNIQVNAIAQNFVDNPTYFPPDVQANPKFQARLQRDVPLGRLVSAEEDAEFVTYLCSRHANCFVGQTFPVSGGWALR